MGKLAGTNAQVVVGVSTQLLGVVQVSKAARKMIECLDTTGYSYLAGPAVQQFSVDTIADFTNSALESAIDNGTGIAAKFSVDAGSTWKLTLASAIVTEDLKTKGPDQHIDRTLLFGLAA